MTITISDEAAAYAEASRKQNGAFACIDDYVDALILADKDRGEVFGRGVADDFDDDY